MKLNIYPENIDSQLKRLITFLGLNEAEFCLLEYRKESKFEAEIDNCHLNVLIKCNMDEGNFCFGWMFVQDKSQNYVEAQFHCVWRSPEGNLVDITPRIFNMERIMFIPDYSRRIQLKKINGLPSIITFDNVNNKVPEIKRVGIHLETKLIDKHNLSGCFL